MNYLNENLNDLTTQTDQIQLTLNTVHKTMQKDITTAVVEAMAQLHAMNITSTTPTATQSTKNTSNVTKQKNEPTYTDSNT